ncbi:hypothetical protein Tco_1066301 [Tanacetum coccineum]|uniref:Uncharacterized protein n=1 Tax=Tanacetum coccineum TaxID=301880 RepID=A0ABQ5HAV5_9ASTR
MRSGMVVVSGGCGDDGLGGCGGGVVEMTMMMALAVGGDEVDEVIVVPGWGWWHVDEGDYGGAWRGMAWRWRRGGWWLEARQSGTGNEDEKRVVARVL